MIPRKYTKKNKDSFIGFRIADAQNTQLQILAEEYGVNKSLLVREAINELLIRHA